jgi:hypothetical protein
VLLGLRGERGVIRRHERQRELALLVLEHLVLLRLLGLALQRVELALDLVHDVAHAHEVLARALELGLRLVALLLVARDARRLFDEDAALVGLGGEDVVELVLVHDRVGARVGAGPGEDVEDVAQAGDALVEVVLALARAVESATHRDLAVWQGHRPVVAEVELDLGHPDGLARLRAVEDQVFHPLPAQGLRRLLAERPADRFRDVRLAAAVGTDDGRDARQDLDDALLAERLEAVDGNRFKTHAFL